MQLMSDDHHDHDVLAEHGEGALLPAPRLNGDHYRYYIVLQPGGHGASARQQERARCDVAHEFVEMLKEWIAEKGWQLRVSKLEITVFGQIQIVCAPDFIEHIRGQDMLAIAEIRPAQPAGQQIRKLLDQISG